MSKSIGENNMVCTLNDRDFNEREQYVRKALLPYVVNIEVTDAKASRTTDLPLGVKLIFSESSELRNQVESFVAMESQCCGFLTFTITPPEEGLMLMIEGSLEAKSTLDTWIAYVARAEAESNNEAID